MYQHRGVLRNQLPEQTDGSQKSFRRIPCAIDELNDFNACYSQFLCFRIR